MLQIEADFGGGAGRFCPRPRLPEEPPRKALRVCHVRSHYSRDTALQSYPFLTFSGQICPLLALLPNAYGYNPPKERFYYPCLKLMPENTEQTEC